MAIGYDKPPDDPDVIPGMDVIAECICVMRDFKIRSAQVVIAEGITTQSVNRIIKAHREFVGVVNARSAAGVLAPDVGRWLDVEGRAHLREVLMGRTITVTEYGTPQPVDTSLLAIDSVAPTEH